METALRPAQLVKEMVDADIQLFRKERILRDSGFYIKNQYE